MHPQGHARTEPRTHSLLQQNPFSPQPGDPNLCTLYRDTHSHSAFYSTCCSFCLRPPHAAFRTSPPPVWTSCICVSVLACMLARAFVRVRVPACVPAGRPTCVRCVRAHTYTRARTQTQNTSAQIDTELRHADTNRAGVRFVKKKKSKNKSDTFSADAYLQRSCGQRRFEKKRALFWVEYLQRRCGLAKRRRKKIQKKGKR